MTSHFPGPSRLEEWLRSPRIMRKCRILWTRKAAKCNCSISAAAKSLQSCPTLCDPIDGSPPGSCVPGILQARTLEWVAISCSNAWKVKVKSLGRVRLFATPWTAAHQAPPPMGFSRQEYWSGVPLPSLAASLVFDKNIHFFQTPSPCWNFSKFCRLHGLLSTQ